jgi:ABC-2 type transport system ATP-binding protein
MTRNDLAISVRGLRKSYGTVPAVNGVDLDVGVGEVVAVLGPNGAGKTTAVEIMAGFRSRDAGDVAVLGEDPQRAGRAWRARIGVVFQLGMNRGFELTVREMVHHIARYYPRPRDPDEVIRLVGLDEKANAQARSLSGGQKRRLDVALSVVGRPELIFLDEPTTGFDPQARAQFWELVRRLAADGTTILLTTHYLEEAEALADRVAVLAGGRVRAVGPPATLGGRATADARVSWDGPDGRETVSTQAPTRVVTELASRTGGEVPGLSVTRPSLEDIYLDLIGASR